MSEFQSYEFRSLDRPLSAEAQAHLRRISSRGRITSHGFSNEYHWGDFKGDPRALTAAYFDVFVYYSNWGTNECLLRLPADLVDLGTLQAYADDSAVSVWAQDASVLVSFGVEELERDWLEEDEGGWIDVLVPLRDELLRGDLRALYIARLAGLGELGTDYGDDDEDDAADELPPVPPGLGQLTAGQRSLAAFLGADPDLLAAAALTSPPLVARSAPTGLEAWLLAWPPARKDEFLLRLVREDLSRPAERLRREFEREAGGPPPTDTPSLSAAELLAGARAAAAERARLAQEAQERERARRAAEAAAAREKYLLSLVGREAELWRLVYQWTAASTPKGYDQAVALLLDLQELARRELQLSEFELKVADLRMAKHKKPSLLERLGRAGL